MARAPLKTQFFITVFLLHNLHILTTIQSKPFSKTSLGFKFKKEKLTHLHFYFHDVVTGRQPTAVKVASAPTTNATATSFGLLMMMDDPLTLLPEPGSKVVGRAQGVYGSADLKEFGFMMALNFYLTHGKYNGSTLSVLGRNAVLTVVREMPVVGGSGVFRFARGYAQAKTHSIDLKTANAVVEYDVFVLH